MSTFGSADSQNCAGENLASHSDKPGGQIAFPPLCGKFCVDEELKLSRENFKQSIYDFFKEENNITPLSQLRETPPFPTPHTLAQFASKVYKDYEKLETDAQNVERLALPEGWRLLTTASNGGMTNGYFGAAYWHPEHQQVVIAHRGTKPTNLGALWTDVVGVVFKHHVPQIFSASTFAHKVVEVLQEVNRIKGVCFQLFFTGHSLGGWLAQVTTFTTKYLKREGNIFVQTYDEQDSFHPHTVVFDSPGCKNMLSKLTDKFDVRLDGRSIDIEHLDITSYLSAPNRINTCNTHLGTVYRIFTDFSVMGERKKNTQLYNVAAHSMDKIVQAFDPETGQVLKDEQGQLKVQVVIDWPISVGLKGGGEYVKFFEWAKYLNNYHPHIKDISFHHLHFYPIRYQTKLYDERVNSFSIFSEKEQEFLQCYRWLRQWPEFFKPKELFSELKENQAQEDAEKILQCFEIVSGTIRCTDVSALQALIPYVKRLLQLYPQIKDSTKRALLTDEVRNRVYQFETRRYVEKISQSPLEFNSDASSFREFVESKKLNVLHLRMFEGEEWTGLIKVHQALQKTDCLIEGQYTVLKLKRLLKVNQMMDLSTLMQSAVTPYLLLIACEDNQQFDEETKDVIRTVFDTTKHKPNIKIIFITRSEGSIAAFLHHIGRRIFGNGFVSRDEQLTWTDLASRSQEKLLEKSVKFQGATISLNELMSAESPIATLLPLGSSLNEKELTIADPVPISNAYNDSYYIGRTFRLQKAIKQDIFSDKSVRDSHVYISSTEHEFKQLCQLNPKNNVHWLEKDKSGKLLWQQSQGSLKILREYIDTESSHTYAPDDLDKLLEQAEHQKVMLISDTAGMGKSTVLTHLSKQIIQKFPTKWVVRIDLNDHTDALKALKEEQIDEKKTIEFVSEKVLKLKPGLEVELFKQCCEHKQNVRIVIMVDGFDEISPSYKETVIDLLQALRQTAVEQLWVTTRTHLREDLEDKLQQLSYTLEPFSEENQIKFLKKFWCLSDWYTEMNNQEKDESKKKLEIYAKKLIKKLGNSISDKDREFTGIPLQTRMLAEAFDEEVKIFCQSLESTPELPFQLDLFGLYGRFIERKYDIYQEEKFRVNVNNVAAIGQRKRELKSMREDHQLLALKALFTEKQVALFQNRDCSFSTEDLTRIGIVQVSNEGKPHFIHRTFAEYYVADYVVKLLTEGNISQQVETFILKDIFLAVQYQIIRTFADGLLSRSKLSEEAIKHCGYGIHELWNECVLILHRGVRENNVNIVGFLLDIVQAGDNKDRGNKLLLAEDALERTIWHTAVFWTSIQVLEKLWELTKEKLTTEEIKYVLLFATDYMGMTVWHVAATRGNLEALLKLWVWANEKLTTEEIRQKMLLATDNYGLTVWEIFEKNLSENILLQLWDFSKKYLTTGEIKSELLLDNGIMRNIVWPRAAQFRERKALHEMRKWAKQELTPEEIKEIILATDYKGRNLFYMATNWCNIQLLQEIWECGKEKLTTEEINNNLLLATDEKGRTVWHVAAERGNVEALEKIGDWAKMQLTTEEINSKFLLATDNKRRTVWHMAAVSGNLEAFQNTWDWAKTQLTTEEINSKLLLATDGKRRTVWHVAAVSGNLEAFQNIWDWAKEKLTTEEIISKLLLATDDEGRTVWHMAAEDGNLEKLEKVCDWATEQPTIGKVNNKFSDQGGNGKTVWTVVAENGNLEALQLVWDWAKEKLTTEEINNELFFAKDYIGRTVWHVAAKEGNLEALMKLWVWANEKLTTEEIRQKLLLATDLRGLTVWELVEKNQGGNLLLQVWDFAKKNLTIEEIKNELLLDTGIMRNIIWLRAAQFREWKALHEMRKWAKQELTPEEIKEILLATDYKGRNLFFIATNWFNTQLLQELWECGKEKLTTEEINNNLLLATDEKGRTVWHVAAERDSLEALENVWDWAKEALTTEEINIKLLAPDNKGRTAWHVAAKRGNLEVFQEVLDWAKEQLTTDEINNKLLLAPDDKGRAIWHEAAKSGNLEALRGIWHWAKEQLTTEEVIKLLLATDGKGRTAWHVAAKRGNLEALQEIWCWAKEQLKTEEINNKLLLATDGNGRTAWHVAAQRGNLESLEKIWDWVKMQITTEEINNKFLLATDKKGRTVWNVVSKDDNLETLQKVWDWAKERLTTEEINNKLLAPDDKGRTVLPVVAEDGNLKALQKVWDWAKK